jgi:hypothetical protein
MSSTSRLRTTASTAGLILLLGAALFGLASLTAPVSMMLGQIPLSAQLMALATSMDYVMGDAATMAQVTHNYTQAFGAIAPHMALGGLAMFLCSLQFIPVLRRRWPRLHRTIGKAAMWAIVTAMVGAIGYLAMTPAGEVFSGEAFAAALWVQAVSTLACLWLAIQAIRAKQYQAHMGWMALLFAILLTAPLMRLEQTVLGALTGIAQAGIRKPNRKDLLLVVLDEGSRVAGVFTRNRFCAAPVQVCREHLADRDRSARSWSTPATPTPAPGEDGLARARATCARWPPPRLRERAGAAVFHRRDHGAAARRPHRRRRCRRAWRTLGDGWAVGRRGDHDHRHRAQGGVATAVVIDGAP